jgi:Mn-dependent DtxR family transcriptional regulator
MHEIQDNHDPLQQLVDAGLLTDDGTLTEKGQEEARALMEQSLLARCYFQSLAKRTRADRALELRGVLHG